MKDMAPTSKSTSPRMRVWNEKVTLSSSSSSQE
jgi:hypothetical protein